VRLNIETNPHALRKLQSYFIKYCLLPPRWISLALLRFNHFEGYIWWAFRYEGVHYDHWLALGTAKGNAEKDQRIKKSPSLHGKIIRDGQNQQDRQTQINGRTDLKNWRNCCDETWGWETSKIAQRSQRWRTNSEKDLDCKEKTNDWEHASPAKSLVIKPSDETRCNCWPT